MSASAARRIATSAVEVAAADCGGPNLRVQTVGVPIFIRSHMAEGQEGCSRTDARGPGRGLGASGDLLTLFTIAIYRLSR